jgi:formate dehydrogenase major subunit
MRLRRVTADVAPPTSPSWLDHLNPLLHRRSFLQTVGVGLGAGAASLLLPHPLIREVRAQEASAPAPTPPEVTWVKTICNNCAVGCGFLAGVQDGVWTRQDPWFEHPVNLGSLCSKGAAARGKVISEKRLRYPMKLVHGHWQRVSWDQAMTEITQKLLQLREQHGPDALFLAFSAHHNNEDAYAIRKFMAFWGSNNADMQARICHSTTVAGLAMVFGVGAMTNSMPDIRNSRCIFICGSNAAEAHPISMQHILTAKEVNRAPLIVADPRFTKTAAFATIYIRHRSGTDIPLLMGLVNLIFENGWEDRKFLDERVYGVEELRETARQYPPEVVEDITGVPRAELYRVAKTLAENRPGTIIWAMGQTQHTNGTAVVRASCALQLVLGNMGVPGGGCNVFRGHDQIQGATDVGGEAGTLPGYYGLGESAWKHWANVWDVSYDWLRSRFASKELMEKRGFTVSRWYEGVLQPAAEIDQPTPIKAAIFWGHSTNSLTQMPRGKAALEQLELLVDIDPFVTNTAVIPDRKDGIYLLPASTAYEKSGSATNSNRQVQWRNQVVKPVWEARTDLDIVLDFARRLGFAQEFAKSKLGPWREIPEDILREINLGVRSIGYIGQTPERLKRQQDWAHAFEVTTQRAEGGPVDGEYWGLPWPCWTDKHPGTPILYDVSRPVSEGGLPFRVRFGERAPDGKSLLAADSVSMPGSAVPGGYPDFKGYATDLTGKVIEEALAKGMAPWGNGRAVIKSWMLPDPIPIHREPIHSPRPDLVAKYPTYDDAKAHWRVNTPFKSAQKPEWVKEFPIILVTGRQVEFEGGGAAERASIWLTELNEMYAEIHPKLANTYGIKHGGMMWVESPQGGKILVKARVTRRVGPDTIFLPFHWGGMYQGKSLLAKFPEGTAPYAIGESANVVTNYGYDLVTQMQESKTGLCRIRKA